MLVNGISLIANPGKAIKSAALTGWAALYFINSHRLRDNLPQKFALGQGVRPRRGLPVKRDPDSPPQRQAWAWPGRGGTDEPKLIYLEYYPFHLV